MKKSQILAALALAFALGVVAPVAGTTMMGNGAYALDVTVTPKTATYGDVNKAIAAVKNEKYNAYKNLQEAYDTAYNTTTPALKVTEAAAATSPLVSDLQTTYSVYPQGSATEYIALDNAISAATGLTGYTNWEQLVKDVTANSSYQDIYNDIVAVAGTAVADTIKTAVEQGVEAGTYANILAGYVAQAQALVLKDASGNATAYTYANMSATITKVNTAKATQTAIKDLYDDLLALRNGNSQAVEAAHNGAAPAAALSALAGTELATTVGVNYTTLVKAVAKTEDILKNTNLGAADLYKLIDNTSVNGTAPINTGYKGLLQLFQTATDKHPEWTVTELVNSAPAAPENPDQKPDEPGTDQPGTDEPGTDDPSAPGTGVVSAAEGNAATTVSIVAGLATALTALGAGVVAYRSARRSNK